MTGSSSAEPDASSCPEGREPIGALLRRGEALFVAEFDRRIKETEFSSLSLAHSRNVLRHLGGGPVRASQLVGQCGVSKQAVSQQLAQLEVAGLITVEPDPSDARARVIALSPVGVRAQCLIKRLFVEIEDDWAHRIGAAELDRLRSSLAALLRDSAESADCSD